jgi:acyl carrier protein
MTDEDAQDVIAAVLGRIAPEIDLADVDADADLRDETDLDSMDFLNLVTGIHERTGIEIPEADYPRLDTLAHAVAYLVERAAG